MDEKIIAISIASCLSLILLIISFFNKKVLKTDNHNQHLKTYDEDYELYPFRKQPETPIQSDLSTQSTTSIEERLNELRKNSTLEELFGTKVTNTSEIISEGEPINTTEDVEAEESQEEQPATTTVVMEEPQIEYEDVVEHTTSVLSESVEPSVQSDVTNIATIISENISSKEEMLATQTETKKDLTIYSLIDLDNPNIFRLYDRELLNHKIREVSNSEYTSFFAIIDVNTNVTLKQLFLTDDEKGEKEVITQISKYVVDKSNLLVLYVATFGIVREFVSEEFDLY